VKLLIFYITELTLITVRIVWSSSHYHMDITWQNWADR